MTGRPRNVGLGCMRLSVTTHRDREAAISSLVAAINHGVNLLDTAPSYGLGEWDEHHNEKLIRDALACLEDTSSVPVSSVRISTKVGLVREGAAWVPDGRAKAIRQSCERSLEVLDRSSVDFVMLHTVDPRTDFAVSLRALRELKEQGLAKEIGVCNVNLSQLTFAREQAPITAVQVAWSPKDDKALRGGVIAEALRAGLPTMIHSPLGGPKHAPKLDKNAALRTLAEGLGATPHELLLAWYYAEHPLLVPLPGAGRVETAILAGRAALLASTLDEPQRRAVSEAAGVTPLTSRSANARASMATSSLAGEVVLIVGIQGSGKSHHTQELLSRGYHRLNRDERGSSLEALAKELDKRLRGGDRNFVLDNTYVTRAQRNRVIEIARAHGQRVRCIFMNTPLEVAQTRVIRRLFDFFPELPSPETLRAGSKTNPQLFGPSAQHRLVRALEVPTVEEGFDEVEEVRTAVHLDRGPPEEGGPEGSAEGGEEIDGLAVLYDPKSTLDVEAELRRWPAAKVLVYAWCELEDAEAMRAGLARFASAGVDVALCSHGGGPPVCWCRPPLAGMLVEWAVRRGIDLGRVLVIGSGAAHKRMARAVGARSVEMRDSHDGSGGRNG